MEATIWIKSTFVEPTRSRLLINRQQALQLLVDSIVLDLLLGKVLILHQGIQLSWFWLYSFQLSVPTDEYTPSIQVVVKEKDHVDAGLT